MIHELLALELLTLLLERPTDDSVEIAVGFLKECGATLNELTPKGMEAVFERFRVILVNPQASTTDDAEAPIDQRVQWMIQVLFQIRKEKFKDFPPMKDELDLVDEDDRITHTISLVEEDLSMDEGLLVFKFDPNFEENERKYAEIKQEIVGDIDLEQLVQQAAEAEELQSEEAAQLAATEIQDKTSTALVSLRKTIYLTIMSSLEFEECCHKLLKANIPEDFQLEVCNMIAECCSQERIYNKFFGLLADRLCTINPLWAHYFEQCFAEIYSSIHRFETNRIRNLSKLFAFLLTRDAISWSNTLCVIRLTEADTTSASRVFIKFLFLEISQEIGIKKLNDILNPQNPSVEWQQGLSGIFPTADLRSMRFAINFFTAIDLGPLTDKLREEYEKLQYSIAHTEQQVTIKEKPEDPSNDDDLHLSDVSLSEDEEEYRKRRRSASPRTYRDISRHY